MLERKLHLENEISYKNESLRSTAEQLGDTNLTYSQALQQKESFIDSTSDKLEQNLQKKEIALNKL